MRTAGAAFLVIVGLLATLVAGPALWVQKNLVETDGFVALVEPLGSNAKFQEGLTQLAAKQATASLNLPPQLEALAATIISNAARGIYSDPRYPQAWTETLQRSHRLSFDAAGNPSVEGDLLVDLAPLVTLIAKNAGNAAGIELDGPDEAVMRMEQPRVAQILPMVSAFGGAGIALAIAAVVLIAAGIILARNRRMALLLAGLGIAAVALVWLIAGNSVERLLAGLVEGSAAMQEVGTAVGALAHASWQGGIVVTLVAGAVLAVAGAATLMVGRRRTT